MMKHLKKLEDEVSGWPDISVHPQASEEGNSASEAPKSGHVHTGGIVDIPFPPSIRNALLAEGLAEEHRWVPNSDWITFRIGSLVKQ